LRRAQLENGRPVLESIFCSFQAARKIQNANALGVLQDQLAANAPALIQANLIDLKTLIQTIQSLEGSRRDKDGDNPEKTLQEFLRGGAPEENDIQGGQIQ
jgi:hypothetical protein